MNPTALYLRGTWRALRVTMVNLFRPVVTESIRSNESRAERFKGSFALIHNEHGEEACIGCNMCGKICPSQIITVKAGGRKESVATGKKRGWCDDFTLDLQACIYCELCVQVCPTDAIVFVREQEEPGFSREDLVLTMDKLYANEAKAHYWGNGTKFMAMQDPKKGMPKPPPKAKKKPTAEPPKAGEKLDLKQGDVTKQVTPERPKPKPKAYSSPETARVATSTWPPVEKAEVDAAKEGE